MHGRVKVLRTEEQERIRSEKKKQIENDFRLTTDTIFSSRRRKLFTEASLNQMTSAIETVPDMTYLWNYRREIVLYLLSTEEFTKEKIRSLLNSELQLTHRCLLTFPKAYAVWHHRMWVMMHHKDPNWMAEVEFCDAVLKADERNFHCWDYRRFVVSHGHIPNDSELKFTEMFIESNLSNYSAWHYRKELLDHSVGARSLSLPLSPPPHDIRNSDPFRFGNLLTATELDLAHNAIFTDSNDQSPWLYYWQILGHGVRKTYLRELYVSRSLGRLVLVFTGAQPRSSLEHLDVSIEVSMDNSGSSQTFTVTVGGLGGWKCDVPGDVSAVWWLPITADAVFKCEIDAETGFFYPDNLKFDFYVCIRNMDDSSNLKVCKLPNCPKDHLFCLHCTLDFHQKESLTRVDLNPRRLLNSTISPIHEPQDLTSEVANVRELVSLESRNKWALLTLIDLLRFVDADGATQEIKSAIETLIVIDPQRKEYYFDMKSSHAEQDALVKAYNNHIREVDLSNRGIRYLHYPDWYTLMTKIDLSKNCITQLPDTLSYLVCVEDFNLDDNQLTNLLGICHLPALKCLSVKRNRLSKLQAIEELLHCISLQTVALHGNRVTELGDFTSFISNQASSKYKSKSFSVTYDKSISV